MIETTRMIYLGDLSDIPCNKEKTKDKPTDQPIKVLLLLIRAQAFGIRMYEQRFGYDTKDRINLWN